MFGISNDYTFGSNQEKEYAKKKIKDWYGDECLEWASNAEQELCIPFSSWVSIDGFRFVTGRDLLRYNVSDFKRIVNEEYGPLFFKAFRNILRERREEKGLNKTVEVQENSQCIVDSMPLTEYPTRVVPEIDFSELDQSQSAYGNALGDYLYFDQNFEPSYSTRIESSRTFLTHSTTLSGGSVVYENHNSVPPSLDDISMASSYQCNSGLLNYDMNNSPVEAGSFTSPIPDFNSLMIQDNSDRSYTDNFDLEEMDTSFQEVNFSELDNLVHSEEAAINIENIDSSLLFFTADLSNVDEDGPLEESMLKKITTGRRGNRVRHPQSWEFLIRLLIHPKSNPSLIKWEDKEQGIFRLVQKEEIAKIWGKRSVKHKDEPLAYDNFARILRYHYKSKILLPVSDKHLVYKLGDQILATLRSQRLI